MRRFLLRSELWRQSVHVYKLTQIRRTHLLSWKKRILFLFFVYFVFLPTWPDWVNKQWSNIIHLTPNLHFQYVQSIKSLINNKKHVPCPKIKKLVKTVWNASPASLEQQGQGPLSWVTGKSYFFLPKMYFNLKIETKINFERGLKIFDKMLTGPRAIWRDGPEVLVAVTVSTDLIFNQRFEK